MSPRRLGQRRLYTRSTPLPNWRRQSCTASAGIVETSSGEAVLRRVPTRSSFRSVVAGLRSLLPGRDGRLATLSLRLLVFGDRALRLVRLGLLGLPVSLHLAFRHGNLLSARSGPQSKTVTMRAGKPQETPRVSG